MWRSRAWLGVGVIVAAVACCTVPVAASAASAGAMLADALGTMVVNPQRVAAASTTTYTFTYTAGSCAPGADGQVAVTVPPGWTPPDTVSGTDGFVASAGGPVSVSGSVITLPAANLEPGTVLSFEYQAARAPGSPGPSTFTATGQSGPGGPAQDLADPPVVMVTPVQVNTNTTPPPHGGAGTTTVTPGRVTAAHPSTRDRMPDWLPILLVVTGLVLAAAAAGLLAFRPLRRAGHPAAGGNVRAVPHSGPPASVIVRDTGSRPALTVRIEPRAGATVTKTKERQP